MYKTPSARRTMDERWQVGGAIPEIAPAFGGGVQGPISCRGMRKMQLATLHRRQRLAQLGTDRRLRSPGVLPGVRVSAVGWLLVTHCQPRTALLAAKRPLFHRGALRFTEIAELYLYMGSQSRHLGTFLIKATVDNRIR